MATLIIPSDDLNYNYLKDILEAEERKRNIEKNGIRNVSPGFEILANKLDLYFIANKLRLYCAFLSYKGMSFGATIEADSNAFLFIPQILDVVRHKQVYDPTIEIYSKLLKLLDEPPAHAKDTAKSLLQMIEHLLHLNADVIHPEDQLYIYSMLATYMAKRINLGGQEFLRHCFRYNNAMINLRYGVIKDKQYFLPPAIFKNLVFLALNLKKDQSLFRELATYRLKGTLESGFVDAFEWVEAFIKEYRNEMKLKHRKVYAEYCSAFAHFQNENFEKAYKIMSTLTKAGRDLQLKVDIKLFFLMCAYEQDLLDAKKLKVTSRFFEKSLDTYRKQLSGSSTKTSLSYLFHYHKEFISLFKKLYKFKNKYEGVYYTQKNNRFEQEKAMLFKEIDASDYPIKAWLAQKLYEV